MFTLSKHRKVLVASLLPILASILTASSACIDPIIPTIGPKIPASEQFETVSGGGATGFKHL